MQTNASSLWQLPAHWVIAAPIQMVGNSLLPSLEHLLSDEELARARRFRQESDQHRYLLAHGLKRFSLSQLLNVEPKDLLFNSGEKGKPICENAGAPDFNLSHSGDWVLCGVSSIAQVGVDVELGSREVSDAVARYSLTPAQLANVEQAGNASERLMLYWTQKEAISKALGLGLSIGFQTIECSGEKGESEVGHLGQRLMLESCSLENYILSVATVAASDTPKPNLYRLVEWSESDFRLHSEVQ